MSSQVLTGYQAMKEMVLENEGDRPNFGMRLEELHAWVRSVGLDYIGAIEEKVADGEVTESDQVELKKLRDPQWAIRTLGEWLGENLYGCWDWLKESHPQK